MAGSTLKYEPEVKALTARLVKPEKRRLWKEIIAYPRYQTNFSRLGRWLSRDGQFEEAALFYRYAVRKHPHSYRFLLKLALACENAGNEVAALRTYRRLTLRFPDRFQPYLRLEKIYRRSLNFDRAIALYRDIPSHNPIKERACDRLYHICAVEGDLVQAAAVIQEAIKNFGESYDRCLELGKLDLRRGDFLGAVQSFESAVAFRPRSVATRSWLGIALKELGNLRLAEYEFNEVLKIKPDSFQGLIHLAELKIQSKQLEEAEGYLAAIEKKSPDNARVAICRGWIAFKRGEMEKAIESCRRGLGRTSFYFIWEQILAHRIISRSLEKTGDEAGAALHRRLADALLGKDTYESLIKLAEELLKKKDLAAATEVFNRVLELFPHNTRAQIGLGEIYLKEHQPEEAINICRLALERIRPIYVRERIRAHTVIALAYKLQNKSVQHKKECKNIHALLRQIYLKPAEKARIKKDTARGK
jgi:tetratricopeptide (TPR) repeat protein